MLINQRREARHGFDGPLRLQPPSAAPWGDGKIGSGRRQSLSTVVGAGRDAATPSSEHSEVGDGSREGGRFSRKMATSVGTGAEAVLALLEYAGDTTAF